MSDLMYPWVNDCCFNEFVENNNNVQNLNKKIKTLEDKIKDLEDVVDKLQDFEVIKDS